MNPRIYSEDYARKRVLPRNMGACEVQIPGVCRGHVESYQHRKRRGNCTKFERWAPSNGIAVCGDGTTGCHGWIHANPEAAQAQGWEVLTEENPAEVSVWLHNPNVLGRELFLLRDDGDLDVAPWDDPKRQHTTTEAAA